MKNSAERIRDLQQKITEWESEQNVTIQRERDDQVGLSETLALSLRVVVLGSIPSSVLIACWAAVINATESLFGQILGICGALVMFGIVTLGAGRASGLAAHWWFHRSKGMEHLAAILIALSADAIVFWWILVLTNWPGRPI